MAKGNKQNTGSSEREKHVEEQRMKQEEKLERLRAQKEEEERKRGENLLRAQEVANRLSKKKSSSIFSNGYYVVFAVLGALIIYIIFMFFMNQQTPLNKTVTLDDKKIEDHNQNSPWKQGMNKFFEASTLADAKRIMNTSFASHSNLIRCSIDESIVPPESFDSRKEWPSCVTPVGTTQSKSR
jgi:hypothetical protein